MVFMAREPRLDRLAPPRRRAARSRAARQRGVALLLSLMLLTILVIIVTQLAWTAKVDARLARNAKDDLKLELASRGTMALVKAHLRADRNNPETAKVDSLRERWAHSLNQPVAIGDVQIDLKVEDCESRLNVNLLAREETKPFAVAVLNRLVLHLQIEGGEEIVQRIVDFVDVDTEGQFEEGAKNGPLLGPDELLAIPDIPATVWLGAQPGDESSGMFADLANLITGGEEEAGIAAPGLLQFLTAWGTEKININTCSLDLLIALIPPTDAQGREIDLDAVIIAIDEFRTGATADGPPPEPAEDGTMPGQDFQSIDDLAKIPGLQSIFPPRGAAGGGGGAGGAGGGGAGAGGGGAGGGEGGGQAPPSTLPREVLTVTSQDFTVSATATRGVLVRRFEGLLRRGREEFYVLMWRELLP